MTEVLTRLGLSLEQRLALALQFESLGGGGHGCEFGDSRENWAPSL